MLFVIISCETHTSDRAADVRPFVNIDVLTNLITVPLIRGIAISA